MEQGIVCNGICADPYCLLPVYGMGYGRVFRDHGTCAGLFYQFNGIEHLLCPLPRKPAQDIHADISRIEPGPGKVFHGMEKILIRHLAAGLFLAHRV